jgi:phage terminase large subunit
VTWLRRNGYQDAIIHLPHDGVNANSITGKKYEEHLRDAGFEVPPPTPNQGRGAASLRIEAVRRIFPKCWFNETTTEAGRDALGFYHEKKDEERNVGLGPDHDWSSHAADGFGLMAINYEEPSRQRAFGRSLNYPKMGVA